MRVIKIEGIQELPDTPCVLYFEPNDKAAKRAFFGKYGATPQQAYRWGKMIYIELPELLIKTPGWTRR